MISKSLHDAGFLQNEKLVHNKIWNKSWIKVEWIKIWNKSRIKVECVTSLFTCSLRMQPNYNINIFKDKLKVIFGKTRSL